jgi:hypothetical protein
MRLLVTLFLCLFSTICLAQQNCTIKFHHLFKDKILKLEEEYILQNMDTISIHTLKYYISIIQFLKNKEVVWKEVNSYHLVDEENIKTKEINLNKIPQNIEFDAIQFNLGIDSTINYSGVRGGDLDPTRGMYWTWQNGYINFKLEGKCSVCNTRNKVFQFHIGGYENGFSTIQNIIIISSNNKVLEINVDIEKLLSIINLSSQNEIMQPSKEAVEIANKLPILFRIK